MDIRPFDKNFKQKNEATTPKTLSSLSDKSEETLKRNCAHAQAAREERTLIDFSIIAQEKTADLKIKSEQEF